MTLSLSFRVWNTVGNAQSYPCSPRLQAVLSLHSRLTRETLLMLMREETSCTAEDLTVAFPNNISGKVRNTTLFTKATLDTLFL